MGVQRRQCDKNTRLLKPTLPCDEPVCGLQDKKYTYIDYDRFRYAGPRYFMPIKNYTTTIYNRGWPTSTPEHYREHLHSPSGPPSAKKLNLLNIHVIFTQEVIYYTLCSYKIATKFHCTLDNTYMLSLCSQIPGL